MEYIEYFDDSDAEDFEIFLSLAVLKPRPVHKKLDFMHSLDDHDFLSRFRVSKQTVLVILDKISEAIAPATLRNGAVPPLTRLLLTLRYFATGQQLLAVSEFGGISEPSASRFISLVSAAIADLKETTITMPTSEEDRKNVINGFCRLSGFPEVVGAIDCTHIKIAGPGGDHAEDYRWKNSFSIKVQTVCDSSLLMRDIVATSPGATHQQTILNQSQLKLRLDKGEFEDALLVGNSGYANQDYLVTPLLQPQTLPEVKYSAAHIRARSVSARCHGAWKERFPVLVSGIIMGTQKCMTVIEALAVCHNLAIQHDYEKNHLFPQWMVAETIDEESVPPPTSVHNGHNDRRRRQLINGYFTDIKI